jgi:hypothetical protein
LLEAEHLDGHRLSYGRRRSAFKDWKAVKERVQGHLSLSSRHRRTGVKPWLYDGIWGFVTPPSTQQQHRSQRGISRVSVSELAVMTRR